MVTNRQKMQIQRQIANKWGFNGCCVLLGKITPTKTSIVIDGGKIIITVPFLHSKTKFAGEEFFMFDPTDLRKMPSLYRSENDGQPNE